MSLDGKNDDNDNDKDIQMRYTTILAVQAAMRALHKRDKRGLLHVSLEEVDDLMDALTSLRIEIVDVDENADERTAEGARRREIEKDERMERIFYEDEDVETPGSDLESAQELDITILAQAAMSGVPEAVDVVAHIGAAASDGDSFAGDIVQSLRDRGVEVDVPGEHSSADAGGEVDTSEA